MGEAGREGEEIEDGDLTERCAGETRRCREEILLYEDRAIWEIAGVPTRYKGVARGWRSWDRLHGESFNQVIS